MSGSPTVPLLDLKPQYRALKAEIDAAIARVVESQQFILGPEVEALEKEIAAYCRVSHALGCSSGTDALLLALLALGVKEGDEVLCPAYTFFATAGSIARLGAKPVFADIDPATFNLDPESTRQVARGCKKLKAILPVHLFGQCAPMAELETIARELGVPIVEDAAQALGSEDTQGRRAGSVGKIGCLSFFPTKNLGAFGDAGMVIANDAALAERMSVLRVHGMKPKYYHQVVGLNARLDALQAAVLRVKLKHLDAWTGGRQANAARYDRAFAAADAKDGSTALATGGLPLRYPQRPTGKTRHIYNQYVIRVPAMLRDGLLQHLKARGIGTEIYYPVPLHLQECFAYLGQGQAALPHAEAAARETLALPIYPELSGTQLVHVAGSIVSFLRAANA
ncbi:MAG: DegT/DnrJ/EryC1/StrS family aminotransferase [Planctomycetes bacterium]|nr:DegT/DnrJ/EryC1/StrS family aminotransferase [Planctomycetota bacterium]